MGTLSCLFTCLLFLWSVRGEVADNFNNCHSSFFKNMPVSGLERIALPTPTEPTTDGLNKFEECLSAYNTVSPAHICQRYKNKYYFATLYDRVRRIPLYSAYVVDIHGTTTRHGDIVNYEPQLVHPTLTPEQTDKLGSLSLIRNYNIEHRCNEQNRIYQRLYKLSWSQAVNDQFGKYDRGHLNPAGHHVDDDASKATMTFTNVAPQNKTMNNGVWNVYETRMKKDLCHDCTNMYAVTGVVPSVDEWVDQNERVNVPSHYWNAYCCTDNKDIPVRSGGAVCLNLDIQNNPLQVYDTVEALENVLKGLMNVDLQIFSDGCSRDGQGRAEDVRGAGPNMAE